MTTGNYRLDRGEHAAPSRLQNLLENWLDPMTRERIEAIGIEKGWSCLEVGPGAGSMTCWLCEQVGPDGQVVALDLNTRFLSDLKYDQLEIREGDIVDYPLEKSKFDLVYARWTLIHIPEWEDVVAKLVSALRPGGWILCIEPDGVTHQADASVPVSIKDEYEQYRKEAAADGMDFQLGRLILSKMRNMGLREVGAEGRLEARPSSSDRALAMRESIARRLRSSGESADEVNRKLAFWDAKEFVEWSPIAVATWGQLPV